MNASADPCFSCKHEDDCVASCPVHAEPMSVVEVKDIIEPPTKRQLGKRIACRKWRANNPEKAKECVSRYYFANKEKRQKYAANWYQENKERIALKKKTNGNHIRYLEKTKDSRRVYYAAWYQKNKERINLKRRLERANRDKV